MELLWNFHRHTQAVQAMEPHSMSPFEDLAGFRYHDHWRRNVLMTSALNADGTGHKLRQN